MIELGQLCLWLATHIALSAVAVAVLAWVFRRQPTVRHAAGVIGLGAILLSPALVWWLPRSAWQTNPVITDFELWQPEYDGPDRSPTLVSAIEDIAAEDVLPFPADEATEFVIPTAAYDAHLSVNPVDSNRDRSSFTPESLIVIGLAIWSTGCVVLAIRWMLARRRLTLLRASLLPCDIPAETTAAVSRATGMTQLPPIFASRSIPIPVVIGHRQPVIAIPEVLAQSGDVQAIRDVLIHECAHVARRDPWIHLVQRIAALVYWPHPGVHLVNAIIARSREEICDNHVLAASQPVEFARTLLEMSERLVGTRLLPAPLGLLGTRWSLENRVQGLLDPRRSLMTRLQPVWLIPTCLLFAALATLLGGVRQAEADPPAVAEADAAANTQAEKTPIVNEAAKKSLAVNGQVTLNGKPVAGVEVKVYVLTDGQWRVADKVATNAEGKFEFAAVPIPSSGSTRVLPVIAAVSEGHATAVKYVNTDDLEQAEKSETVQANLELNEAPGDLKGTVVDSTGKPVAGVDVFVANSGWVPIPGLFSAKTDALGRFSISGLKCWSVNENAGKDSKTGTGLSVTRQALLARHPDFALTNGWYTEVPQNVRITMKPASIIKGMVIDEVSGKPAPRALVQAQGVARGGWAETRADEQGRFSFAVREDHYNIWAVVDGRMPVAVKALPVAPGKETPKVIIRMVRGGVVTGRVLDASSRVIDVDPQDRLRVAHYGPARPRTGAAVTSVTVEKDGTYRLPVAPGSNYVYLMNGTASARVDVGDGQAAKLDLVVGQQSDDTDDPDLELASRLNREALEERLEEEEQAKGGVRPAAPPKRQRPNTPVGKLLDKLEQQNTGRVRFTDKWLRTLKDIVDIGPDAVPELIAELDTTTNDMMMRCMGYTLRAIGDKRAIPTLIRTIPKTLVPAGSDMGLRADDPELLKFAQQHDLHPNDRDKEYSFGRPVREVFGALHKLTGANLDDERLYHTFDGGADRPRYLKQRLFHRQAVAWEEWWKANGANLVSDPAYRDVNLPAAPVAPPVPPVSDTATREAKLQTSNPVLSPPNGTLPYAWEFYDLDTGRAATLPKRFHGQPDSAEVRQWAMDEGFDLMGGQLPAEGDAPAVHIIRPLGLSECRELGDAWWKKEPKAITLKELRDQSRPAGEFLLHRDPASGQADPKATATYLYVTSEGTAGLLYIGVDVQDDTLKPGGVSEGDNELNPIAFRKGRRFAPSWLVEKGTAKQ